MKSKNIKDYLDEIGANLVDTSNNSYEIARFVYENEICVIYEGKKGLSGNNAIANKVIAGFQEKRLVNIQEEKRKPNLKSKFYKKLLERDGNLCFYSGKDLTEENSSIEHLIPLSKGGKNNLDNLVLCLKEENQKMANSTLISKIKYKINNDKSKQVIAWQ